MCDIRTYIPHLPKVVYYLIAVLFVVVSHSASAQSTYQWTNTTNTNSYYDISGNWNPSGPPDPNDTALFNDPNTYEVWWDSVTGNTTTAYLRVYASDVTFRHDGITGAFTHTVTDDATVDTGSLTLGTSGHPLDLSVDDSLYVYHYGQLNVLYDSDVTTSVLYVGTASGVPGAVADMTVDGTGSTLNVSSTTYLGQSGSTGTLVFQNGSTGNSLAGPVSLGQSVVAGSTGVLELLSGSTVSTGNISAGAGGLTGQSGTISVEAPNSVIMQTGSSTLTLGAAANSPGLLQVTGSGTFTSGTGAVTVNPTGRIEIDGGTLNVNGLLDVDGGEFEQISGSLVMPTGGQITIQNGGDVVYDDTYRIDDDNTVSVSDSGSTWHSDALLYVGDDSVGTLNLTSDADLTATGIVYIGRNTDANGTVSIDGSGTTFISSNSVYVGREGTGTLNVTGGADLTANGNVYVGQDGTADGTVLVDGSGTRFSTPGSVYVGGSSTSAGGNATFTVSNDAVLSIGNQLTIYDTANFTLNGSFMQANIVELATPGASLNTTGTGWFVANTLEGFGDTIDLDCGLGIGTSVGGSGGSHTVGAGQTLDVEDILYIGNSAPGTLTIIGGGEVTNGSVAYIGRFTSADGSSVSVNGAGSTWANINNSLVVGVYGDATMNITNGGKVETYAGHIAKNFGSQSSVTVSDTDSLWDIGLNLYVGGGISAAGGDGTLVVGSAGTVVVENTLKVWDTGTLRLNLGAPGGIVYCDTLELATGDTLDSHSGTALYVNALSGAVDSLSLGGSLYLGHSGGSGSGAHTVGTGQTLTGLYLGVSIDAPATLTINGGGDVISNVDFYIGRDSGGNGMVDMTGAGSTLSVGTDLLVGNTEFGGAAIGTLNVAGDADVTSGEEAYVGHYSGSQGTVTLGGAGTTWTNGDELYVGGSGTGQVTINTGATLTNGGSTTIGTNGTLTIAGGTFVADGNVTVQGGRLERNSGAFLLGAGQSLTAENGGEFAYNGGYNIHHNNTFNVNSSGKLFFSGWLDIGNGVGDGTLNVDGPNSLVTTGGSSYWGDDGYSATVALTNEGAVDIGPLELARSAIAGTTATVDALSGSRLTINGELEMVKFGGATTSAVLNVDGPGSLVEQNSAADNILGFSSGGPANITVRNFGQLELGMGVTYVNPSATITINSGGVVTAPGPIEMNGGTFDFLGGTLHATTFNGDLINQGGTLAPGESAGNTLINGNYTQQSGAALEIEIGGPTPGADYDTVDVTGGVSLDGYLDLYVIGGFPPASLDTFSVLNAGSIFFSFDNVLTGQRLATLDGIGSFLVHYGLGSAYSSNQIWLTDFERTYSADYDYDGDVDGDDLAVWEGAFGSTGGADADGDGDSDGLDLLAWQRQFGSGVVPLSSTPAQVPEPSARLLLMFAVGYLATTRWE